jgi:hypothetical protein
VRVTQSAATDAANANNRPMLGAFAQPNYGTSRGI